MSTDNAADYALTGSPTVFTNNAGDTFALTPTVSVGSAGTLTDGFGIRSYPNPFYATTRVTFTLSNAGDAALYVTDASGRRVREMHGAFDEGSREFVWDGRDFAGRSVPAGMYFYELRSGRSRETGRVLVVR